ncbi:MAG TPA: hypothetical protein VLL57_06830, partial [Candidatus Binataceae bacterium]|nr:hypothetical protein [Candidatus Binataceae bacterium]
YACPAQGCQDYVVKLDLKDSEYMPGASTCGLPTGQQWSPSYDPATIYTLNGGAYAQPNPPNQNQLVYAQNGTPVVRASPDPTVSTQGLKHSVPVTTTLCPNPTPTATPTP